MYIVSHLIALRCVYQLSYLNNNFSGGREFSANNTLMLHSISAASQWYHHHFSRLYPIYYLFMFHVYITLDLDKR